MPNPVDDAPVGPGQIALPLDTDHSPATEAARLRRFRLRAFYFVVICFTITLVAFFEHPPAVERPVEELERTEQLTDIALDPRLQPYQTPESADHCAEWVLEPAVENLAFASFELPTAADLLFFLSRGPVSGHISIIPTYSVDGPIEVNVTAQYHHDEDLERAKACRTGAANEHGLLLWAEPRHPHRDPRHGVRFNVTVGLPNGVSHYKDLSTDLALFSHSAGKFFHVWSPTWFDVIRLRSSNAAINFGSLVGSSAFIQTTNAKVNGFFAGLELVAQTSNASMDVFALMFGESPGSESRVNLTTSNGAISARLELASKFAHNTLRSVIRTTAASLAINTPKQSMMPPNASFLLDAATTVGPVTLNLYPEFEGTYDLRTTGWGTKASVEELSGNVDPAGNGRRRTVTKESTGRHARGKIYWSKDGKPTEGVERGDVRIATTVSPVKVNV
ncbi:hypothetical protein B0H19DRAFT_1277016 [Mycena capillaripes]|nr:hypothetical protein B0H19DRAFT_1277016 [Mycena capillaripes]